MDISKATEAEKMNVCRKYFYGGFLFLPWLWVINGIWFLKESRTNPKIRKLVVLGWIFAAIYFAGLIIWATTYQRKRADWGEFGDKLAVILPKGYA